jgi:threonine/homoserine/homoserine lactone efflux protein
VALPFFVRGAVLGFAIAAPVGPIGLLCIRRTLSFGRAVGLVSGLGAATADMCYGAVAAFGLTAVAALLVEQRLWLHVLGSAALAYLGVRTLLARPAESAAVVGASGGAGAYASTLALTLTNPATIFSFAAVFAGAGALGPGGSPLAAALVTAGVFCGSALWWVVLSTAVGALRARLTVRALRAVNVASGCLLLGFAAFSWLSR